MSNKRRKKTKKTKPDQKRLKRSLSFEPKNVLDTIDDFLELAKFSKNSGEISQNTCNSNLGNDLSSKISCRSVTSSSSASSIIDSEMKSENFIDLDHELDDNQNWETIKIYDQKNYEKRRNFLLNLVKDDSSSLKQVKEAQISMAYHHQKQNQNLFSKYATKKLNSINDQSFDNCSIFEKIKRLSGARFDVHEVAADSDQKELDQNTQIKEKKENLNKILNKIKSDQTNDKQNLIKIVQIMLVLKKRVSQSIYGSEKDLGTEKLKNIKNNLIKVENFINLVIENFEILKSNSSENKLLVEELFILSDRVKVENVSHVQARADPKLQEKENKDAMRMLNFSSFFFSSHNQVKLTNNRDINFYREKYLKFKNISENFIYKKLLSLKKLKDQLNELSNKKFENECLENDFSKLERKVCLFDELDWFGKADCKVIDKERKSLFRFYNSMTTVSASPDSIVGSDEILNDIYLSTNFQRKISLSEAVYEHRKTYFQYLLSNKDISELDYNDYIDCLDEIKENCLIRDQKIRLARQERLEQERIQASELESISSYCTEASSKISISTCIEIAPVLDFENSITESQFCSTANANEKINSEDRDQNCEKDSETPTKNISSDSFLNSKEFIPDSTSATFTTSPPNTFITETDSFETTEVSRNDAIDSDSKTLVTSSTFISLNDGDKKDENDSDHENANITNTVSNRISSSDDFSAISKISKENSSKSSTVDQEFNFNDQELPSFKENDNDNTYHIIETQPTQTQKIYEMDNFYEPPTLQSQSGTQSLVPDVQVV